MPTWSCSSIARSITWSAPSPEYYLERAEPTQREDESNERFDERHNKWKERCDKVYGIAEVIVGKQRHGPIGTRKFQFDGNVTSFSDLALDERLPDQY
jgi:replicative DNA helicase